MRRLAVSRRRNLLAALVLTLAGAVAGFVGLASPAAAGTIIDNAAAALRTERLYVAPNVRGPFGAEEQREIRARLEAARTPIYLAVLPEAAREEVEARNADRVPYALATATGEPGTYATVVGRRFSAGSTVIGTKAGELAREAATRHGRDPMTAVLWFVASVEREASGAAASDQSAARDTAPAESGGGFGSVPFLLLLILAGGLFLLVRSARRRSQQARADAEELAMVRRTVDEDITAYGEQLDRLDPDLSQLDDAGREDFRRALDSYEQAKQRLAAAQRPADMKGVSEALEEGRFALACVQARMDRRPLPERRPPCFFDPRHGPSVEDVEWAPAGGTPRPVPVCAADAVRIREGLEPLARTVDVDGRQRPYWEAGPAYGPWAAGWFGAYSFLPGLLVGTMLGSSLAWPGYYGDWSGDAGADAGGGGGDFGGGGGDFGGGGGDFGGGGGFGDFGGGGGDFGG
jgi:hypothetical protein